MGRVALVIDRSQLESQIRTLESKQKFENRTKLYEAICQTEWAKNIKDALGRVRQLSPANIYQRVKEFGLEGVIKTQQGKRGNPNLAGSGTPKSRAESIRKKAHFLQAEARLKYDFRNAKDSQKKMLNKLMKGSLKAAIALKCYECCCGQLAEARRCTVYGCPLWPVSPYTGKGYDAEVNESEPIIDDVEE